nr:sugar nucleotide-binding protein [Acidobacteriota bacterium]
DIAAAIDHVLLTDATGVWHFANGPGVTRLEFARAVFEMLGEDRARVAPLDPAELALPARRPDATPLSTRRFEEAFGWSPRPWTDVAREYLARRFKSGAGDARS